MQRDQVYQKTLRHFFKPVADLLFEREDISEVLINGHNRVYC